jgi:hypothetical protein
MEQATLVVFRIIPQAVIAYIAATSPAAFGHPAYWLMATSGILYMLLFQSARHAHSLYFENRLGGVGASASSAKVHVA